MKELSLGSYLCPSGQLELSSLFFQSISSIPQYWGPLGCLTKISNRGKIPFSFEFRHWWQYVIVIGLIILAFSFMYAGKVESIVFDKQLQQLQLWKTSILCLKDVQKYSMRQISGVRVYRRGHNGVNVYTIHYKINVDFKERPSLKIMETQSREKAVRQV